MSDAAQSSPSTPSLPARRRLRIGRTVVRLVLLLVVPVAAVLAGLWFWMHSGRYVTTENAYVKANIIAVSTDVDGRVEWVGVNDNDWVESGQPLFRIDPTPFRIAVEQAEAQMEVVRSEIESMRADYRESLVEAAEARERVHFNELQLERQKRLRDRKLGREEDYDSAAYELATARQRVRVIEEKSRRVLASLAGDPEIAVESHPRFLEAKAARDRAAVDLGKTRIAAPSAGIVSNMRLQPGEYVEEGKPIFSLIETAPMWVEANLKETQLTWVREGQAASIEVDAYPDLKWSARVSTIAPATGAEFALLPPQNASGNWVKVVQRIPVILAIDQPQDAPPLRAGMTVSVSIDTEREREMPKIAQKVLEETQLSGVVQGMMRDATAGNGPGAATPPR
ncbi:MAG: HlyD family secretion protein [Ectothiorhodospiraceae bacterium]|nr:HlyD family secretion protein [Ectothiorhodospiraceae bacterium]